MPSVAAMRFNQRLSNTTTTMDRSQSKDIIPVTGEKKVFEISSEAGDKNGLIKDQMYNTLTNEYLQKEPCRFSHDVFLLAGQLFGLLKHEQRPDRPFKNPKLQAKNKSKEENVNRALNIDFPNERSKRLSFELVFTTLKYQRFLEDILDDCNFFNAFPEYQEDEDTVMVILCDFQKRKFQLRVALPGEALVRHLLEIEEALIKCRTKLNAALARSRIKARVLSIDQLLPESVRQTEALSSGAGIYVWVNSLKTDMRHIQSLLNSEGCMLVENESEVRGKAYCHDSQCGDVLIFPSERRLWLEEHQLLTSGRLVMQDKSSCLAVEAVRGIVADGDDVLHINCGSGLTAVHLASRLSMQDSLIFTIGLKSDEQGKKVSRNIDRLRAGSYVRVVKDDFLQLENNDDRLRSVRVVLLTANCTRSGVGNPVGFVVTEEEDMDILTALSVGSSKKQTVKDLESEHTALLQKALQLPSVQCVIYCTRSVYENENEEVVARAMVAANEHLSHVTPVSRRKVCRLVPPTVTLSQDEVEGLVDGKYLKYPPTPQMSGCFIATIVKEVESPQDASREALSKAVSKSTASSKTTVQLPGETSSGQMIKTKGSKHKKSSHKKKSSSGFSSGLTVKTGYSHGHSTKVKGRLNMLTDQSTTGSSDSGASGVSFSGGRVVAGGGGGVSGSTRSGYGKGADVGAVSVGHSGGSGGRYSEGLRQSSQLPSFITHMPSLITDESYERLMTNRTVVHAPPRRMPTPPHRKVVQHPQPFRVSRPPDT